MLIGLLNVNIRYCYCNSLLFVKILFDFVYIINNYKFCVFLLNLGKDFKLYSLYNYEILKWNLKI